MNSSKTFPLCEGCIYRCFKCVVEAGEIREIGKKKGSGAVMNNVVAERDVKILIQKLYGKNVHQL